jgi:cysteine synthase
MSNCQTVNAAQARQPRRCQTSGLRPVWSDARGAGASLRRLPRPWAIRRWFGSTVCLTSTESKPIVGNQAAFDTARALAHHEGIPGGISSGAAVASALKIGGRDQMQGKCIAVVVPSCAERYLSTALFENL